MGVINYIVGSLIIVFSIVIIAVVLLQEGKRSGLSGSIAGGADTFLSKNKSRSVDAFLSRWTKFITIGFFILVIAATAIAVITSKLGG